MIEPEDTDLPEEELYEHLRIEIDKGQELLRIDKFLMNRVQNATRTKIQHAAEAGSILVNGKPVKSNYKVKPFDVISIVLSTPPREIELIPENIPINIVYEDEDILAVNKEPGMVVHPGYGNYKGTLVNALVYHFQNLPKSKTSLSPNTEIQRPGIVHRIDKNTSGLLVIAKNLKSHHALIKQMQKHEIHRHYQALVYGNLISGGTIDAPIGRHPAHRIKMAVLESGKNAVTHYRILERFLFHTLLDIELETGRTHQIRVHLSHKQYPIVGDSIYKTRAHHIPKLSEKAKLAIQQFNHQALHAYKLILTHPLTKESLEFNAPLPQDFLELISLLREDFKNSKK